MLEPTATSFHCLKMKCDIWVKGRPRSILSVTSFPLVPRLLFSSEVHLKIPNTLSESAQASFILNRLFLRLRCHQTSYTVHYHTLYELILHIGISSSEATWHGQPKNKELGLPARGQEKCGLLGELPRTSPKSKPQDHPFKFQPDIQSFFSSKCFL